MSKVTIFSTGGANKSIDVNSTTWGDLQKELSNHGVSTSGMKAVVGQTRVTLEHKDAQIPSDDFNLFLLPVKTKSGLTAAQIEALPYKDLRSELARLAAADGEAFKSHFNQSKNYTTKSTGELKELLITYKGSAGAKVSSVPVKETAKVSRTMKAEPAPKEAAKPAKVSSQPKSTHVVKTKGEDTGLNEQIDNMVSVVKGFSANSALKDAAIRALSALKAGASVQVDSDALRREAKELAAGFNDLKSF